MSQAQGEPFPPRAFQREDEALDGLFYTAPRLVVSFSNRMFPTKAVRIWRQLDDEGHVALVGRYFRLAGGFEAPIVERHVQTSRSARRGWFRAHDPLYAVIAIKS